MLPSRYWAELTAPEIEAADMARQIAILPVAATEQHGPHLPLGTDTFIMEGYLARALSQCPDDVPALALPTQTIGCSVEHGDFRGTLSLSAQAALAAWKEIGAAVAKAGCRKLVVMNAHGGNSALADILAHELRAEHGLFVVLAAWQRFGYPEGLFDAREQTHGIHAGAIETSLMLALRPDLVRKDRLADHVPTSLAMEARFTWLRAGRPTGFGWMAQDLSATGVMGDAAAGTAAMGEACLDHGAKAFVALLRDVAAFDTTSLTDRRR